MNKLVATWCFYCKKFKFCKRLGGIYCCPNDCIQERK